MDGLPAVQKMVLCWALYVLLFFKGTGQKAVLVIFIHGTIEISSIIIAGGLRADTGQKLDVSGHYTRLEGLIRGAKDSLKIVLALVAFFPGGRLF